MRSKLNLHGSPNPRVADKLNIPRMPVEWLDAGTWRLPSGKALAEFALQAGFLAPLLFKTERFGGSGKMPKSALPAGTKTAVVAGSKQFEKGGGE